MDGHQRAVHHPEDFLPLAGSVLVLAASFINFVWVQESTQADRQARLLAGSQYAGCLVFG
jgi:hypothetical protein